MADVAALLAEVIPSERVLTGDAIVDEYGHDESLHSTPQLPAWVVQPQSTAEVSAVLRIADEHRVPVTPRGSGTGMSGAAIPQPDGILLSFEHMGRLLEIDVDNQVAVVQPGLTLAELDAATADHGLVYPVFPGENSASLGGNVATNAGGMRAVKYGVTRHQVVGLEAVLANGEVIRTGGKYVKGSTGYDLTQLIVGSEGTLAVVTEATIRLYPRPTHQTTILAPYPTLDAVTAAVPKVIASGVGPLIVEYIDMLTMGAMTAEGGLELGVPDDIKQTALAYLVIALEGRDPERLDADTYELATLQHELGALDVYVLPSRPAEQLIQAREQAFFLAKANGADDIVDVVVPRAAIAEFMTKVGELAASHGTFIAGCGHAGDGNVHLSVFQRDADERYAVMRGLFEVGMTLGGAISGEHGIGLTKKRYFLELEDPVKVDLMRRIKTAFDPNSILNPGTLFD